MEFEDEAVSGATVQSTAYAHLIWQWETQGFLMYHNCRYSKKEGTIQLCF